MESPSGHDFAALVPTRDAHGLHLCPTCGSELVQPDWWEEVEGGCWRIRLRCPECDLRREGIFGQTQVDAFDERLNAGTDDLTAAYRRLTRENLAAELERFAGALRAGAILPEDF